MNENLVIVESPAKAGTIKKILGENFIVKSSFGHIRDLKDSGLGIDIENNFTPLYTVPSDKKKVVSELKQLAKSSQTVWLASDEDREGEAISWHLFETLGLKKENTKRIVFHEITPDAILHAVENPRDINMDLVNAQQARRVLDRLVGFELSPVLWRKIQPRLSAGRVQSVALKLVVDREREILNFKKTAYYRVEAQFRPDSCSKNTFVKAILDKRFETIEDATTFLEKCKEAEFKVVSIETKEGFSNPTAPFTTSSLQQEASRKLHLSVSQTMSIAQRLYEQGYITYMRTDSTNLSSLAISTAKEFIINNYGEEYSKTRQFKTNSKGAQEAHEAIRPTYINNTSIEGTAQEKKLYELIWKRTVASQMAQAKFLNTDIKVGISNDENKFEIQAKELVFDGFLKVYTESVEDAIQDDETVILPHISIGEDMHCKDILAECKYTAAPHRYSEASLVKKMEELGIGRPATYAPTIETLTKARGYLARGDKEGEKITVTHLLLKNGKIEQVTQSETYGAEKRKLLPQDIGMVVNDYLSGNFDDIINYDFTANIEKGFDKIAKGQMEWKALINDFYSPFHAKVEEKISNKEYNRISREIGIDPSDGQMIVAKFGQYGAFVQKGEGDTKQCASLGAGQLIESIKLEDAIKLFQLPRNVGKHQDIDIICTKGRFGPYIKYGDKNVSIPRNLDPLSISLEECINLIENSGKKKENDILHDFTESGIQVINGNYGPYIKYNGHNYKIPKGTEASALTENDCKEIVNNNEPTSSRRRRKK